MRKTNGKNRIIIRDDHKYFFLTILLTSAVFWILYARFFFGDAYYMYEDIGGDTLKQYIPQIIYDLRNIHEGASSGFDLTLGFGKYYVSLLYKYLNPVNWPLLLFGYTHLNKALVLATWLKALVMAVFSFLFFRRVVKDQPAAVVGALLWTFCSFAVLWGQHYHFLTSLAAFTVELYGLQLFLEGDRKQILLVPSIAYLAYCGYVFLYISSFFVLIYSIAYLVYTGAGIGRILKKAVLFALSMILAVGIAGEYILPNIENLFTSTRVGTIAAGNNMGLIYGWDYLAAFLGRFISTDQLGVGLAYKGPVNYYEIASITTSVLFIFAIVYLFHSGFRKRTAFVGAVCLAALISPYGSRIISLKSTTQRWTFLLCLAEILAIIWFLKLFRTDLENPDESKKRRFFRCMVTANLIIGVSVLILRFTGSALSIFFQGSAAIRTMLLMIIWDLIFIYLLYVREGSGSPFKQLKRWTAVLMALICLEMVVTNYDIVNTRGYVTEEKWYTELYNDGTEEVLNWLKTYDPGTYRINKTYQSAGHNDQMVQQFNGVSIYDSTNTAEAVSLMENYGYDFRSNGARTGTNWLRVMYDKPEQNTYMAVKYLIARKWDKVDTSFFFPILETEDYTLYQNSMYNGFGYFYEDEIPAGIVDGLKGRNKGIVPSHYFYYSKTAETEEEEEEPDEKELLRYQKKLGLQQADLLGGLQDTGDCSAVYDGILHVTGEGDDMRLVFDYPEKLRHLERPLLHIKMICWEDSKIQLFPGMEGERFSEANKIQLATTRGVREYTVNLSEYKDMERLRVDPSTIRQNVCILEMYVDGIDYDVLKKNLEALRAGEMPEIRQDGNTFYQYAVNDGKRRMLCIPLVYSSCWSAQVDGEETDIYNINGGLIGLWLEPGGHAVQLTYTYNTHVRGREIGAACAGVYVLLAAVWLVLDRRKHKAENKRMRDSE